MITKVKETIEKYNLIKQGTSVTVALSGGADSVALLCVLLELGYKVSALHINHGIRGEESNKDEQFCVELCQKKGVPLKTFHLNLTDSSEEEMRKLRYDIFAKEDLIATAHHIEDNTETVMINITRGTSVTGLCGIPPCRNNIIRPLLECTRDEIELYLKEKNQSFCVDSTNKDNSYTRNYFRNIIIPQIKKINPSLDMAIYKMSESLREDNKKAEQIAILKKELSDRFIEYDFEKLNRLYDFINHNNGSMQVSKDYLINANNGKYKFILQSVKKEIIPIENIQLIPNTIKLSNEIEIVFEKLSKEEIRNLAINQLKEYKNCIDCDKIKNTVSIRSWKKGEYFKMLRRPNKLLSDIFTEEHIPSLKRSNIPIITKYDKPVWVEGLGVTEKYSISNESKNVIHIIVRRNSSEE